MSTTRRCAASSLSAIGVVFLLRSCGAFVAPPTGAGTRGPPDNKATGHGSTFGGVGLELAKATDMTALPGRALGGTSNSFAPEDSLLGDGEGGDARRVMLAAALVEMDEHEVGGNEGGSGVGGRRGRWGIRFRKARGAVARIWKRGGAPVAGEQVLILTAMSTSTG